MVDTKTYKTFCSKGLNYKKDIYFPVSQSRNRLPWPEKPAKKCWQKSVIFSHNPFVFLWLLTDKSNTSERHKKVHSISFLSTLLYIRQADLHAQMDLSWTAESDPVWDKQKLCINLKNCQSQEYNFPKATDEDQILMKTSVLSESHSKYEIWFFPSIISSSGICLDPSFAVRDFSIREA